MYICANMNALVLPIVIFTLSYLKWIKVLLSILGFTSSWTIVYEGVVVHSYFVGNNK